MNETSLLIRITKAFKKTTTPFDLFRYIVDGILDLEPDSTPECRVEEFIYQVLHHLSFIEHEGNMGWYPTDIDTASMEILAKKLSENREFVYGLRAVFGACFSQYSNDLNDMIRKDYEYLVNEYRALFMFI